MATDGAITPRRREAIFKLTDDAGFKRSRIALLTAYQDREAAGFKKTVAQLAWDSFAWFAEPGSLVVLRWPTALLCRPRDPIPTTVTQ